MTVSTDVSWKKCFACQEELGEDPAKLVAISKRCYDVFHESCIKEWLHVGRRSCPLCKLSYFSKCEVIPNPEYLLQYQKYKQNPREYSFERACVEELGHSHEQAGIDAEHILRPKEFRGLKQPRSLTEEEINAYFDCVSKDIDNLRNGENVDEALVEKLRKELLEADELIKNRLHLKFDAIEQKQREIREEQREIREEQREIREGFTALSQKQQKQLKEQAKQQLLISYERKVELLEDRTEIPYLVQSFRVFKIKFEEAAKKENSEVLLRQVDVELEAFIESQPQGIQDILKGQSSSSSSGVPPPTPVVQPEVPVVQPEVPVVQPAAPPPEERPAIGIQWQNFIPSNITRRRCIKGLIYLAAFVVMTALWRKGIPVGFKFWQDRAIKPLPKALENQVCS